MRLLGKVIPSPFLSAGFCHVSTTAHDTLNKYVKQDHIPAVQ